MIKLLHVVFSTNIVEFLKKTFEANKKIDFSWVDVRLFQTFFFNIKY